MAVASPLFDLSGRVAVVTGANTGLGQAIAVALATAGADVASLLSFQDGIRVPSYTASKSGLAGLTRYWWGGGVSHFCGC